MDGRLHAWNLLVAVLVLAIVTVCSWPAWRPRPDGTRAAVAWPLLSTASSP